MVRFDGNKISLNGRESSRQNAGENGRTTMLENQKSSSIPGDDSNSCKTASKSSEIDLSFIEFIKDIKSLYTFIKKIGDGKFGTVFLAHPRADSRTKVAIKLIPQTSFSHRIEKELALLKSIEHTNVIKYISAYRDQDHFYIVTEYWEGGELFKKIVDQGGIDELEASGLITQILSAVKFLHDTDVCHRDLKPENILFKRQGEDQVKIIDFGLSKQMKKGISMKKKLGTPYYIAPEILEENYGKEVDLWSIGVITYVVLWGYPPFFGNDAKELFINIYNVNYEFWDEDWGFISEEAKDFISRLLIKDPKQRMNVDEALSHPWIMSSNDWNRSSVLKRDELISNLSDWWRTKSGKLDVQTSMFSRSAECTTIDSYEKWLFEINY